MRVGIDQARNETAALAVHQGRFALLLAPGGHLVVIIYELDVSLFWLKREFRREFLDQKSVETKSVELMNYNEPDQVHI